MRSIETISSGSPLQQWMKRVRWQEMPPCLAPGALNMYVPDNLMMAICLIALVPSVILVLLLRRFVVEGLSAGAMKG